ncbi:MAG: gamma-glutamyltransferase [Azospirillaceae bacterium]
MTATPDSPPATGGGMRNEASPTPNIFPPPESMRPTLVGDRWMVSAGHPLVAEVAGAVLEAGGTAIDAGVAGGFASNVVQADMCNLGGVAPMVVRPAGSEQAYAISGVGWWGRSATPEAFRARHGDDMPLGAPVGVVPAAVDAWITALARFGTRRLGELIAPAIALAAEGFPLDHRTATAYALLGTGFASWETSRRIYWPEGRPPRVGDRLVQRDLARTLGILAEAERAAGGDRAAGLEAARAAFYEGDIAARVVAWCRAEGGWLDADDLAEFRSTVTPAPSVRFGDWRVFTTDTYSQGPVLLQALSILDGFDLASLRRGGADHLHLVAEALKIGFSDRERHYGDPDFPGTRIAELLADDHVAALRGMVDPRRALPDLPTLEAEPPTPPARGRERHDTTYLCVVDAAGNAFSAMPSDTIDGAPILDGLGFFVSPRGVQSRLDPAHPAALGPRRRPRLTPTPALALGVGGAEAGRAIALGCPGGDVIVQAMLQAFLEHAVFGRLPQQAVEAPRIATFAFPDSFFPNPHFHGRLSIEKRVPEAVRADLAQRGHALHVWPEWEFDAGGVCMAGDLRAPEEGEAVLFGAADPRRTCYARGR